MNQRLGENYILLQSTRNHQNKQESPLYRKLIREQRENLHDSDNYSTRQILESGITLKTYYNDSEKSKINIAEQDKYINKHTHYILGYDIGIDADTLQSIRDEALEEIA
ncbi:MAG: hypothetical protein GXP45_06025 [bacterium]|nr:hypothetical protein [bacterium]